MLRHRNTAAAAAALDVSQDTELLCFYYIIYNSLKHLKSRICSWFTTRGMFSIVHVKHWVDSRFITTILRQDTLQGLNLTIKFLDHNRSALLLAQP